MAGAGVHESLEALLVEPQFARRHLARKLPSAQAVLGIVELVEALRVVEEREEEDELRVAPFDLSGQSEPRPGDGFPVLLAVIGVIRGRVDRAMISVASEGSTSRG